ncbi:LssY C-terminal domain-containing protein [Aminobacter carboxidus]|uniref:LssY C-terminal domain-containing protein n=1 Tax=Aminobacter carboxidus TaxID=376165 RepID=A0A8E1W9L8_9HYPH|nr:MULTISPECIES: LssY C-terminal domain-containing protein [Aminobacter carboxidus group]MBB6464297.1 hypothetical protein [Aminobacter lissarensis]MBE1207774.1 LssY C-terminal domain-containing protein [Aminobacter carboxidus]
MLRGKLQRQAALWFAALCAGYLMLAYFAAPEFWSFRFLHGDLKPEALLTTTEQGIPGDPINIGLVGTEQDVVAAFTAAGWDPADQLSVKSAVEIGESVLLDRPYVDAPVSTLLFNGRSQNLAFEKPVGNSPDTRHHVRLWLTFTPGPDGRPTWYGAASFDRGVGISHDTGAITHHIGPDIDAERNALIGDLTAAGHIESVKTIPGIGLTKTGRNGEGDPYFTDGKVLMAVLVPAK